MAQSLVDPVLPGGHLRLSALGDFSTWSQGYGKDFAGDTPLDGSLLLPGLTGLERALSGLAPDASAPSPELAATGALVSRSTVRIPLSLELGIFDWLTVGASLPLRQSRVEAELNPEMGGGLGVNPALATPEIVNGFLGTLAQRRADVALVVDDRCGADPNGSECLQAVALTERLLTGRRALRAAYAAAALFPAEGSPLADYLSSWAAEVDAALGALGVAPLQTPPPLAANPLDADGYAALTGPGGALAGTPLNPLQSLWAPDDLEVSTAIRVFEVAADRDSTGAPGLRASAAVTATLRVPLAGPDSLDVFGENGLAGGQRDVEFGGWLGVRTHRLALRARARYTRQEAGTVETRRTAAARALGAPPAQLSIDPGDETEIEVEPALRLAPALSLGGLWRHLRRGEGATSPVEIVPDPGTGPEGPPFPATFLPALGALALPAWSSHEVGVTLTYRTVDLGPADGRGFEAFLRIMQTVGGDRGPAPRPTRATMGVRLTRGLWGS